MYTETVTIQVECVDLEVQCGFDYQPVERDVGIFEASYNIYDLCYIDDCGNEHDLSFLLDIIDDEDIVEQLEIKRIDLKDDCLAGCAYED